MNLLKMDLSFNALLGIAALSLTTSQVNVARMSCDKQKASSSTSKSHQENIQPQFIKCMARKLTSVDWRPVSVFPEEAQRFQQRK